MSEFDDDQYEIDDPFDDYYCTGLDGWEECSENEDDLNVVEQMKSNGENKENE